MIESRKPRFNVLFTSPDGAAHVGLAEVRNGSLRVYHDGNLLGTYLGFGDPAILARLLLRELVQKIARAEVGSRAPIAIRA